MSVNSWREIVEIIKMEEGEWSKEEVEKQFKKKKNLTSVKRCNRRYFICFYQLALRMKRWDMTAL